MKSFELSKLNLTFWVFFFFFTAQLAAIVKYTDHISAERQHPAPQQVSYPGHYLMVRLQS